MKDETIYVVIGASGYLGSYLLKNILELTQDQIITTYNTSPSITHERIKWFKLDVSDFKKAAEFCNYLASLGKNLKVIYLSAYHNPDKIEKNIKIAWQINIVSLANLINNLPNISTFYYSSTDNVYGESISNYRFKETDNYAPVNQYGVQKSLAENIVLSYGQNVIHYPFLIGPSIIGKKHFYDIIVENLKNNKKIEAFVDSYRSSLDFNSAAFYTIKLIEQYKAKSLGVINLCSDHAYSKYDVMLKIAKKFNYDSANIVPISIKDKNNIFIAQRANSTLMDNSKMKNLLLLQEVDLIV